MVLVSKSRVSEPKKQKESFKETKINPGAEVEGEL